MSIEDKIIESIWHLLAYLFIAGFWAGIFYGLLFLFFYLILAGLFGNKKRLLSTNWRKWIEDIFAFSIILIILIVILFSEWQILRIIFFDPIKFNLFMPITPVLIRGMYAIFFIVSVILLHFYFRKTVWNNIKEQMKAEISLAEHEVTISESKNSIIKKLILGMLKMKKNDTRVIRCTLVIIGISFLAWFVWPTLYKYEKTDRTYHGKVERCLIKINRITGTTYRLDGNSGWIELPKEK